MSIKTRWFRFSLRTSLVLLTCIAVAVAWFSHYARKREAAFEAIRQAGGDIHMYAFREPGIESRLEMWFGSDLFGRVRKVDLREGDVDNELLSQVGVLRNLQRLDLSNADIDDDGLRRIAHLPLQELWLQDTDITDASAATLSKMKQLDFLQLNATSLSDSFLAKLEPLPRLKDLGLRGTRVTGGGMRFLSRHPKLEQLDVYHTSVDDSGVRDLIDCQSLRDIGLSMTRVTDSVFEHLDQLPNLETVDLTANRPVTTAAVLDFEKTHPTCDIEWYRK